MKFKSIPLLLLLPVLMFVLVGCGGGSQPTDTPTPDIEATVEARVKEALAATSG